MTTETRLPLNAHDAALPDLSAAAPQPSAASRLVERIAERMGGAATAATVFGTPIERDGVTVVPVAKARWGFGGGEGTGRSKDSPDETGSGSGAGGGAIVTPLGYLKIKDGDVTFERIRVPDPLQMVARAAFVLAAGFTAPRILNAIRKLRGEAGAGREQPRGGAGRRAVEAARRLRAGRALRGLRLPRAS